MFMCLFSHSLFSYLTITKVWRSRKRIISLSLSIYCGQSLYLSPSLSSRTRSLITQLRGWVLTSNIEYWEGFFFLFGFCPLFSALGYSPHCNWTSPIINSVNSQPGLRSFFSYDNLVINFWNGIWWWEKSDLVVSEMGRRWDHRSLDYMIQIDCRLQLWGPKNWQNQSGFCRSGPLSILAIFWAKTDPV